MGHFIFLTTNHHYPYLRTIYALLTLASCCIQTSLCEIKNTRIIEDSRPIIVFERFGFLQNGYVSVSVKDVYWRSANQNIKLHASSMGFFLVREVFLGRLINESLQTEADCVLSSSYASTIFRFDVASPDSIYSGSLSINKPDEYSLVFGNCQTEIEISMGVHSELYNIMEDGIKDYLSAGQVALPKLYFLFFLIYTGFFAIWAFVCTKHKSTLNKIHLMMAALLIFKALKMICASEDKMYIRRTGTPHGWDVAFYVFGFLKGIMLFMVIILIGTGWSFLKPYLQEREKKVLMMVIPLQVLENIAAVVINETGPATKDWMKWNQFFLLLDVICCCAVFFPIIWSIKSLRESSNTDGKAARNLEKLTLFKLFYIVVVIYLYFTRVMVPALGNFVNFTNEWVMTAAGEAGSLAFYIFIFHNFQPTEKNPYLEVGQEEDIVATQVSDDDDEEDPFDL